MKTLTLKFIILAFIVAQSNALIAQRRHFRNKPKNNFNVGIEGLVGTRSFKINSDITAINKMGAFVAGKGFGVMIGNKTIHTKVTRSYFNTESMADQKLKLIETEGMVNLFPLQMIKKKSRYFEPYFIVGLTRGSLNFYGNYIPASMKGNTKKGAKKTKAGSGSGTLNMCTCGAPLPDPDLYMASPDSNTPSLTPAYSSSPSVDPLADPDKPASDQQQASSYLGKVVINRATIGAGLQCHIPGASRFMNLFAEAKYGIPFITSSGDTAFKNTNVSSQLTINFGIEIGIGR